MSQSLNSSFDSFIENFFTKTDNQLTLNSSSSFECPASFIQETNNVKRTNIMLLLKLVIKELFKHRSKVTLTPECKIFFDHLFVCLEKCLQHGLKVRKQMFGTRIEIWNVLETIEKSSDEARDVMESVRHLPKIRTSIGRARAWFRLTMMKKKLADFFQELLDQRHTVLVDYYEPYALIMSEDGNVVTGLLVGLNSFDYNVYIKDEFFDLCEPVVDLKYYLRETIQDSGIGTDTCDGDPDIASDEEVNVQLLLDQNQYVEQINQRLKSTIKSLECKLENLSEAKSDHDVSTETGNSSLMEFGSILADKEKQLIDEVKLRDDLEKRFQQEAQLREEAETARNLLESDIQEKQDTIVTLRGQLDEVKTINIQLFKKMQERESEITEKNNTIAEHEAKMLHFKKEIKLLEKRLSQQSENTCDKQLLANYQKLIDEQQEQMTQMQIELEDFRSQNSYNSHLKEAYNLLKKKYDENELALEEIGKQLQDAKLEIESLREYNGHLKEAAWAKDSEANKCKQCDREFTLARRKHHCRSCGEIFCSGCSNNEMPLPSSKKPVRVCDSCHAFLLERYSRSS